MVHKRKAVIGATTGLCAAGVTHITGGYAHVHDSVATLFKTNPLAAYLLCALVAGLAGAFDLASY